MSPWLCRDGAPDRGQRHEGDGIDVALPEVETVEVDHRDPDGAALLCRNSLLASASVELFRSDTLERSWQLDATAHAEVGGGR